MSEIKKPNGEVVLRNVRLAFPDLFTPVKPKDQQNNPKVKEKYQATFLVAKDDPQLKEIEAAIMRVSKAEWGKDAEAMIASLRPVKQQFFMQDGDGMNKKHLDGFAGHMAVAAKNPNKMPTLDRHGRPVTEADNVLYRGCYVNAKIEIYAQNDDNKGIRASLLGVVFNRDGAMFGGGRVASADELADLTVPDQATTDLSDIL